MYLKDNVVVVVKYFETSRYLPIRNCTCQRISHVYGHPILRRSLPLCLSLSKGVRARISVQIYAPITPIYFVKVPYVKSAPMYYSLRYIISVYWQRHD